MEVVIGTLQDSYQQFQYQLSCKLARDHPELSELLCVEMMTRQLDAVGQVSPRAHIYLSACSTLKALGAEWTVLGRVMDISTPDKCENQYKESL